MNFVVGTLLAETINLRPSKAGVAQQAADNFPSISVLISSAINIIFVVAVLVFFFMLVIGGIRWITSGGDKAQTEGAKGQITASIIGLVVVLASYAIVNLIEIFFGIDILVDLDIGPG